MKAPGKWLPTGLTLVQLFRKFPDGEAACKCFKAGRWPEGLAGRTAYTMDPMTMHCCRFHPKHKMFSLKAGTVMQSSPLGYQVWAIAIYQMTTSLKSVSSIKLHHDLGITQQLAWFLTYRLREADMTIEGACTVPVDAVDAHFRGKRKNAELTHGLSPRSVVEPRRDATLSQTSTRVRAPLFTWRRGNPRRT